MMLQEVDRIPSTSDEEEVDEYNSGVQKQEKIRNIKVDICQRIILENKDGTKKEVGNYTKKQACHFCQALVSKIGRHLTDVHHEEPEVQAITVLSKKNKDKKKKITLLRNRGNYNHNMDVIKKGQGTLITVKRPTSDISYHKFYPCPSCLGFYHRLELWRHVRTCEFRAKKTEENVENVLAQSRALLININTKDPRMAKLMSKMRTDRVFEVISEDVMIRTYGGHLLDKHGERNHDYIRQKLRHLGHLVLLIRKDSENESLFLADLFNPELFDMLVASVKTMASNAGQLKIGSSLNKIASLLISRTQRDRSTARNIELRESAQAFLTIFDAEWSDRISSQCLRSIYDKKMNKTEELPLTSDLVLMTTKLKELIQEGTQNVLENATPENGRALAEAVLSRLVLFNKRRGGEQSKMLLATFLEVTQSNQQAVNEEIFKSLSPFEQKLSESMCLVKIRGKRGRHVPVLIPSDVKEAMLALVSRRKDIGILEENPYFFALPNKANSFLLSWNAMNKLAKTMNLQCPELIKSTRLRKYLATTSQGQNSTNLSI